MTALARMWEAMPWRRATPPPADALPPPPVLPPVPFLVPLRELDPAARRVAVLREVVNPTLAVLDRQGLRTTDHARVMLLAIAGQEGDCLARRQVPVAHAMGLWQFERGGGVAGVLRHRASAPTAASWCLMRRVPDKPDAVHAALERDDVLACAFARLLLWTDAAPLPVTEAAGWACYLRVWRPGKPHPERWARNWRLAHAAVHAAAHGD